MAIGMDRSLLGMAVGMDRYLQLSNIDLDVAQLQLLGACIRETLMSLSVLPY
jgi:hypothetical protein